MPPRGLFTRPPLPATDDRRFTPILTHLSNLDQNLGDTLEFTDQGVPALEDHQFPSDNLGLSQQVVVVQENIERFTENLNLQQQVVAEIDSTKVVVDELNLRQTVQNIEPVVGQITTLNQIGLPTAVFIPTFIQFLSDTLALTQRLDLQTNHYFVGDHLQLHLPSRQSVTLELESNILVTDTLSLNDLAHVNWERNYRLTDIITFSDNGHIINEIDLTTSDTLVLTDEVVPSEGVDDTLDLDDEATWIIDFIPGDADDDLDLDDTVSVEGELTGLATDTLGLTQLVDVDREASYTFSDVLLLRQSVVPAVLGDDKYFILQAPYHSLQTTILLPCPIFDDTENLISDINLKRAMNGETYTYVKRSPNKILRYTWKLARMKALEVQEFIRFYNSSEMRAINWKGEVWRLHMINNPSDFAQVSRWDPTTDRTDISLEFEGVKLSG